MSAMQLGRHAYVEKPLSHDVYESRQLTKLAQKKRLVTQMGIQIHSAAEYRLAVRLIQDLAIARSRQCTPGAARSGGT